MKWMVHQTRIKRILIFSQFRWNHLLLVWSGSCVFDLSTHNQWTPLSTRLFPKAEMLCPISPSHGSLGDRYFYIFILHYFISYKRIYIFVFNIIFRKRESQVLIIKINVVSYELMYSPNTMGHSNLIFKLSNVINY
jgi:hypothetical protein